MKRTRCDWATAGGPLDVAYHDEEWGVPSRDDGHLFEMLILEGAQAGLSWTTILNKREGYRSRFAGFDPNRVARFTDTKIERLLEDSAIVRNRLKVQSAVQNAKAFLKVQQEFGTFADYLWAFVDDEPIRNRWRTRDEVPAETPLSKEMSRNLRKRGFKFCGPTICYAYMQSCGLVNDHLVSCFRY